MKHTKLIAFCFNSFLILGIFYSCEKTNEPYYDYFIIKVDSIQVANKATIHDRFDIKFYGLIGYNGCYHFSEFKVMEQEKDIIIEAWGKIQKNTGKCTANMVYIDDEILYYRFKEKGIYTLKVKQPDNTYLEEQVLVE